MRPKLKHLCVETSWTKENGDQKKSCKHCIHGGLSTGHRPAHILTRVGDSGHLGEFPARNQLREDGPPDVGWPGASDRHSGEVAGR
jgi:hypothetical protein